MTKLFKKQKKTEVNPDYVAAKDLITVKFDNAKALEELMNEIAEATFVTTSPVTGEMIDAVRPDDVSDILKRFLGIEE